MLPKVRTLAMLCLCVTPMFGMTQVAAVKVTVHVPSLSASDQGVFIAGSFNGWKPGDTLYKMTRKSDGVYTITLPLFKGKAYEYKYALGKWDRVEVTGDGSQVSNRQMIAHKRGRITDTVANWNTPKAAQKPPMSPQMQKINAMKDSALARLKPELGNMLMMLKEHITILLQDNPRKDAHQEICKRAMSKLEAAYSQVSELIWNIFASFSPEQKQKIRTALSQIGSNEDFLNNALKAIGDAVGTSAATK